MGYPSIIIRVTNSNFPTMSVYICIFFLIFLLGATESISCDRDVQKTKADGSLKNLYLSRRCKTYKVIFSIEIVTEIGDLSVFLVSSPWNSELFILVHELRVNWKLSLL